MQMGEEVLIVFTTWPDAATAHAAGRALVEEKRAACVNLLPGVKSIYQWKGELEQSNEVLMLAKTPAAGYSALAMRIRELHPYEVPEIIAVPVSIGLPEYLQWVVESSRS